MCVSYAMYGRWITKIGLRELKHRTLDVWFTLGKRYLLAIRHQRAVISNAETKCVGFLEAIRVLLQSLVVTQKH